MAAIRKRLELEGRLQGIGFRPFVWRLAKEFGLGGFVFNHSKGVTLEIQGSPENISAFILQLKNIKTRLPLAGITSFNIFDAECKDEPDFIIADSRKSDAVSACVMPDIATCSDCVSELFDADNFRYHYPFINCTNCGPRYSIIEKIPYDRCNTTMKFFTMCPACSQQYQEPTDRRFHAQPVACSACGAHYSLADKFYDDTAISKTADALLAGQIAAVKGIGGYNLLCDATNYSAVSALRNRKHRDAKPFALMACDLKTIEKFAVIDDVSTEVLTSLAAPIVLLKKKQIDLIAANVAEGVNTFGVMLPYCPMHYLLFADGRLKVLVMTSGNISSQPLICRDATAFEKLGSIADIFLTHNRQIFRRVDDSVVHIVDSRAVLLRRSRGYVPSVFNLQYSSAGAEILAAGADLKNTFCLVKDSRFLVSEHIGDIAEASVYKHWLKSIEHLSGLFEIAPKVFACDLHPAYLTSQYIRKIATAGQSRVFEIQHHWAHIASVLAEYELDEPVIGLVADGTGYGTDGAIWGCECLIASLSKFNRFGHLAYYKLPGGDTAAKQAIRPLLGLLDSCEIFGFDELLCSFEPDLQKQKIVKTQLAGNVNVALTSSLGRIFDAVALICELGTTNNFEAQLPMALEAVAAEGVTDYYNFEITDGIVNISEMLRVILSERQKGVDTGIISAKFHNTVAQFFVSLAVLAKTDTGINKVALSGGVFCNRYLLNRLLRLLREQNFEVFYNASVPSNDGGISLGQAAIAAKLMQS